MDTTPLLKVLALSLFVLGLSFTSTEARSFGIRLKLDGKPIKVTGVVDGLPTVSINGETQRIHPPYEFSFSRFNGFDKWAFCEIRKTKINSVSLNEESTFQSRVRGEIRLNLDMKNCWLFFAWQGREIEEFYSFGELGDLKGGNWLPFEFTVEHEGKLSSKDPVIAVRSDIKEIRYRKPSDTQRATFTAGRSSPQPSKGNPDKIPELKKLSKPVYPKILKGKYSIASAVIGFEINEAGKPVDFKIYAATAPEFADAAIEAIKESKFTAGTQNGNPASFPFIKKFVFE